MGERKIGETFRVHGVTYEVVKSDLCKGCALEAKGECLYTKKDAFGNCSGYFRKDHTDVIFVRVD